MKYLFPIILLIISASPLSLWAQELLPERIDLVQARIVDIISERTEYFPGSTVPVLTQDLRVKILRGDRKGEIIEVTNDLFKFERGDRFILRITSEQTGRTFYSVSDVERRPVLIVLLVLFLASVLILGGRQGLRSLGSLALSFIAIWLVLIPLLLRGFSPLLVGSGVAIIILFLAIVLTHGWKRSSLIAFFGTTIAVFATGLLAAGAIALARITGLASHEAVYLNFNTGGIINFSGLFLAGIIIGMLGVLDDISITQVAVVRELRHALPNISKSDLFLRAIRIGKDHTGSLVNTLVLAYVGVALPTILYFSTSSFTLWEMINQEFFASEIIRTLVGSLGLVMTVPLVTWLAVMVPAKHGEVLDGHSHHH